MDIYPIHEQRSADTNLADNVHCLKHQEGSLIARTEPTVWFGYFHLFIVATGCPSERRPPEDG